MTTSKTTRRPQSERVTCRYCGNTLIRRVGEQRTACRSCQNAGREVGPLSQPRRWY